MAKKIIVKTFRKARRRVCRFIISFDDCPVSCRKNYKELFTNVLLALLMGGVCMVVLTILLLMA